MNRHNARKVLIVIMGLFTVVLAVYLLIAITADLTHTYFRNVG